MFPWTVIMALVATPLADEDLPPLVPSGMDLLYSDRVPFQPSGEPIIAMGIMTGQSQVQFTSGGAVQIDFYDHGVLKRSTVQAGQRVTVTLRRAQPAQRTHYVDLEGKPWGDADGLDWSLSGWRARGYSAVQALEEGAVLGLGGRVLDNRQYRIVIPTADAAEAEKLSAKIYDKFRVQARAAWKLQERPWAELRVVTDAGPLGTATSYLRISPMPPQTAPITLYQVEHDRGYSWHGRQDRGYRGEIYIVVDPDGKLAAVNVVGAETVLAGVVPSELFASAPPEALKAQAVAARNHLLAKLGRRHHGDPFHLCSDQHCQVYTGLKRVDPRTSAAVTSTAGEAVFHDDGLVHAVYSSTCGGHTEDNDVVWGETPSPALRGRPDFDVGAHPNLAKFASGLDDASIADWVTTTPETYCAQAKQMRANKFRWERTFTGAELENLGRTKFKNIHRLSGLEAGSRGPGGKVSSLVFLGANSAGEAVRHTLLLELPIRRLLKNLNSGAFMVDTVHDTDGWLLSATFRGGGWGHGVGMCQLGAIGRAQAGHSYRQILSHYYNGATIAPLYTLRKR